MNTLIRHSEQDLSCAGQIPEPRKYLLDDFLDTKVGVEQYARMAIPQIADRRRITELTPSGLRSGRLHHPRAHHAELELADAALHTQQ